MADRTAINYVDASWNPVAGCTPVSAGCQHCFAARYARRHLGAFADGDRMLGALQDFNFVRCRDDQLDVLLHWRQPRTILVPTLGDLFHPDVPDEFIDRVFAAMAHSGHHRLLLLTKRPVRMQAYLTTRRRRARINDAACQCVGAPVWSQQDDEEPLPVGPEWPLRNVWLGVSVEDQATADARIPILLQTPAAHRWVSVEPMIGLIDFIDRPLDPESTMGEWSAIDTIDWVVIGGETGPRARVCRLEWIRDVVGQCRAAGVPVWVKQLGRRYEPGGTYLSDELLAMRDRPAALEV